MKLLAISLLAVMFCSCATAPKEVVDESWLTEGYWGWRGGNRSCENNPHQIRFSDSGEVLFMIWEKPFPMATGRIDQSGVYKVVQRKPGRLVLALEGETRRAGGRPVVWELIIKSKNEYTWYRRDWPIDQRTRSLYRCAGV